MLGLMPSFVLGAVAGPWIGHAGSRWLLLCAAMMFLGLVFASQPGLGPRLQISFYLMIGFGFSLGCFHTRHETEQVWPQGLSGIVSGKAQTGDHWRRPGYGHLSASPDSLHPPDIITVQLNDLIMEGVGPHPLGTAQLRLPDGMPAPLAGVGISFTAEMRSYRGRLYLRVRDARGITWDRDYYGGLARQFGAWRSYLGRRFDRQLSPRAAALARSLILGERFRLSADAGTLRQAGAAHFLSVSGLHLGLLALLLLALPLPYPIRAPALAAGVVFYALLSGARPPALRAAGMLLMALIARRRCRAFSAGWTLLATATVALALSPGLAKDLGFLLSFSALGGILWIGIPLFPGRQQSKDSLDQLESQLNPRPWSQRLGRHAAVGTGALLGTAPAALGIFATLAPASLASSLLLLPLVAALLLLFPLTLLWDLGFAAEGLSDAFFWLAGVIAKIPGGQVAVTAPDDWALLAFITSLLYLALRLNAQVSPPRRVGTAPLVPLVVCLVAMVSAPAPPRLQFKKARGTTFIAAGQHALFFPSASPIDPREKAAALEGRASRLGSSCLWIGPRQPLLYPSGGSSAAGEQSPQRLFGPFSLEPLFKSAPTRATLVTLGKYRLLIAPGVLAEHILEEEWSLPDELRILVVSGRSDYGALEELLIRTQPRICKLDPPGPRRLRDLKNRYR